MKNTQQLNKLQLEQVAELGNVTSKEFASSMLRYTRFGTSEQLDNLYDKAVELEETKGYIQTRFDMNYYSVVSEYCMLENDTVAEAFGYYGNFDLYMDDQGRGLVVENY